MLPSSSQPALAKPCSTSSWFICHLLLSYT
jgi:hypothetical protein